MGEIEDGFEELRHTVEPKVRQPDFGVIRGRHRRRVRNQRIASGTLAVVAITAGYGVANRALNDTAPNLGTAAAVTEHVPPPTGEFGMRDVAFVDAKRGWAIGSRCGGEGATERCQAAVSRTVDAGDTWSAPVPVGPTVAKHVFRDSTSPASGVARSVRFFNSSTGYAFNPALFVTADAGRTWRPVPVSGQVVGVNVSSLGVLVTTRQCPPEGSPCTTRILRDRLSTMEPGELAELPAPLLAPRGLDSVQLRVDGNDIWVLSYGRDAQYLEHSSDVGRRWQGLRPPCPAYDRQHFSAAGQVLWVVCTVTDDAEPRRSAKTVYTSSDAGKSWERRGTPDDLGVTNDLKAVSDTTAFLSSSHGDLLRTTDGGRSWQVAAEGEGFINLEIPFTNRGWFFGPNGALWRYADGKAERLQGPR